jgi:hypothetical protein
MLAGGSFDACRRWRSCSSRSICVRSEITREGPGTELLAGADPERVWRLIGAWRLDDESSILVCSNRRTFAACTSDTKYLFSDSRLLFSDSRRLFSDSKRLYPASKSSFPRTSTEFWRFSSETSASRANVARFDSFMDWLESPPNSLTCFFWTGGGCLTWMIFRDRDCEDFWGCSGAYACLLLLLGCSPGCQSG